MNITFSGSRNHYQNNYILQEKQDFRLQKSIFEIDGIQIC
jgi:hypothetical protein